MSDFGTIVLVLRLMGCVWVVVPAFGEICVCSRYWRLYYVVVQRLVVIGGCIKVVVLPFIGKHAYCCVA